MHKLQEVCWHLATDLLSTSRYQNVFAWLVTAFWQQDCYKLSTDLLQVDCQNLLSTGLLRLCCDKLMQMTSSIFHVFIFFLYDCPTCYTSTTSLIIHITDTSFLSSKQQVCSLLVSLSQTTPLHKKQRQCHTNQTQLFVQMMKISDPLKIFLNLPLNSNWKQSNS